MSVPVTLVGYFDIPTGKAEQFRANCEAMLALRDKQPGLLGTAYGFDGDTAATSREDYENADAVVRHMELGEHIYERTRDLVEIRNIEIHGPEAELSKLRNLFSEHSPRFFTTEFSFRR
jgi:hypothetical protein